MMCLLSPHCFPLASSLKYALDKQSLYVCTLQLPLQGLSLLCHLIRNYSFTAHHHILPLHTRCLWTDFCRPQKSQILQSTLGKPQSEAVEFESHLFWSSNWPNLTWPNLIITLIDTPWCAFRRKCVFGSCTHMFLKFGIQLTRSSLIVLL